MKRTLSALALLLACSGCASAGDSELEQVRKVVTANLPGVKPEMVTPSAAPGVYQIQKGSVFAYVTRDGRFLIQGDMVDLVTGEEVTEAQRSLARVAELRKFGSDQVIEFPAPDTRHWVTVFTDIDCGYCRQMHAQMAEYHAQGIGIRYLFYPRSGPNTDSWEQAKAVWCSADRKEALTQAKRGVRIKASTNCPNPIQRHYDAGDHLGINATPMIILPDGELVRGYVRAPALAARLGKSGANKAALNR
jgi:thiol:disulfide interchange protein DsbC